ncbi:putative Protein of unknown function DUF3328 [Diplodia seriata]|uniref:ABM domain-containing protein n=1 Tax=Diplodia seriata TaxID=420778 RepID=A0A0G2EJ24_9PEZI|nr:putative Protein of unknown function DUF3328 [Diplodia seriata]
MAPTTENAILQLKPDTDLTTGDAAATWRSTLATISAQLDLQRLAWGQSLENPHIVQMLIDWDDATSHQAFQRSPAYAPFLANITSLLASPPRLTHHAFSSSTTTLDAVTTAAPVTELVSFYFPPTYRTDDFVAPWDEFARVAAERAEGLRGSAAAWADEDDVEHASLKKDGAGEGRGRLFLALIGWESVDAHMAYRDTAAFKESIVKLRALVSGVEMHHVDFKLA